MEKILKIEAVGSELISYTGYHKEKEAEKILKSIKYQYRLLCDRYSDNGSLIVNISTYNPELPYIF